MMNPPIESQPYREDHEIRRGFTLLEASAGTGKTYSLTFLYLRLLLEKQLEPRKIVVVTFTNAAAAELRDRIHQRIADAIDVADPSRTPPERLKDGEKQSIQDILERVRATGASDAEILHRLNVASSTLDTSVISTIHSFAGRLGEEFSTITGTPSGATLIENLHDTLDEVLLDLEHQLAEEFPDAARLLVQRGEQTHACIRDIAHILLDNPDVLPPPDEHLFLTAKHLLDAEETPYHTAEQYQDYLRDVLAHARSFLQWMQHQGRDEWTQWFQEVRNVKAINGNLIRAASIEKSYDSLEGARMLVERATDDVLAVEQLAKILDVHADNGGVLRFFRASFLQEEYKENNAKKSAFLQENGILGSAHDAEQLWNGLRQLHVDGFQTIWCYRVAQIVAQRTLTRASSQGVRSHAQVISAVARALRGKDGATLAAAVQERFQAALIDEFQDTDSLQWEIFRALFPPNHAITYLIGDPKQAIYGFRGANVAVYNSIRQSDALRGRILSLNTNYRSDKDYNDTLNRVFDVDLPTRLEGFVAVDSPSRTLARRLALRPIDVPPQLADHRTVLTGGDPNDALVVRYVCETKADPFAEHCAEMIAFEIATRLNAPEHHQLYADDTWRGIQPGDCAVLVRNHHHASVVIEALQRAGIPAVRRDKQSVALSDAADALMHWLQALAEPRNARAIRSFLFSPLLRMPLEALDALTDADLSAWAEFFSELRNGWYRRGLHAALRQTLHRPLTYSQAADNDTHTPDVMSHLLQRDDGLRVAGDLMHLAEVLNTAQRNERLSIDGLRSWFARARYDEAFRATENPLFQRRIASDDKAVQVVTGHGSKGLEYPLVWGVGFTKGDPRPSFLVHPDAPQQRFAVTKEIFGALSNAVKDENDTQRLSEADLHTLRTWLHAQHPSLAAIEQELQEHPPLALSDAGPFLLRDAIEESIAYAAGEDLRILYVALTRARLRTVLFVSAQSHRSHNDTDPTFALIAKKEELNAPMEPDERGIGALQRSDAWRTGTLRIEQWLTPPTAPLTLPTYQPPADLDETIAPRIPPTVQATRGQRPSFSSLLHLLPDHFSYYDLEEEPPLPIEGEESPVLRNASALESRSDAIDDDLAMDDTSTALPLSTFASGREAGTALHSVFELVDFEGAAQQPVDTAYLRHVHEQAHRALVHNGIDPHAQTAVLRNGVLATLQTPFGGVLQDFRLADLSRADRIDEMKFLMPVGDRVDATTTQAIFSALTLREDDDAIDPAWFEDLRAGMLRSVDLHGMMIGFIDLVFRATVDGQHQYFVVDYKSNRLAPQTETITSSHFTRDALRNEMRQHHYYLQYHLYLVALHRWLRTRIADYDYDTHIGGAYYLFVRGMAGPHTPLDDGFARGVFFDRPPKHVIEALDRALHPTVQDRAKEASV